MAAVLVMGPGRSGSHFLRDMLVGLGFNAVHEERKQHIKGKYIDECDWEGAADWLQETDRRALCGYPYGLMVNYLRYKIPELRVICVHRAKESWVKSSTKGGFNEHKALVNARAYPRNVVSLREFWSAYESLMWSIAPPVLHLKMGDLDGCRSVVGGFIDA